MQLWKGRRFHFEKKGDREYLLFFTACFSSPSELILKRPIFTQVQTSDRHSLKLLQHCLHGCVAVAYQQITQCNDEV